ncbi:MAG: nucleoside-diphosphate kinase [Candidatus Nezhaarchaeota archaeon]|nr:nucleoside-diphosphate kinase [Candidatus Nezhaarchaeota archaeon]MCX8141800.1 nucleoside-diphosphate kinase [Candidatus Nezhaarchaeota archaeon]MDW8050421.1 nucleoside-diphosphate kinase [Nitrososphaerota archaeon]
MIERTLIIIKPGAVVRGLIGEVLSRLEKKGLKIIGLKMLWMSKKEAEELYSVHKGKPFYEELIRYITSAPVVIGVVEGEEVIQVVRRVIGPTNPKEAPPGTIRGDYGLSITQNIIHASDSKESAEREIKIFFNEYEIHNYSRADEAWL